MAQNSDSSPSPSSFHSSGTNTGANPTAILALAMFATSTTTDGLDASEQQADTNTSSTAVLNVEEDSSLENESAPRSSPALAAPAASSLPTSRTLSVDESDGKKMMLDRSSQVVRKMLLFWRGELQL